MSDIPDRIYVSTDRQWAKSGTPICTEEYVRVPTQGRAMADVTRLEQDSRPIEAVWLPDGAGHRVGFKGVTRIVLYQEAGEMAMVPWFAVYRGDYLTSRMPARAISEVEYAPPETEGAPDAP